MHLQDEISCILKKEAEKFGKWAFGKYYEFIGSGVEFMNRWNEKHGDKFMLKVDGNILEDLTKMIEIWKKENIKIID